MIGLALCIVGQHDIRLVLLAVLVCGVAGIAAASLLSRHAAAHGRARRAWLTAMGIAFGSGVWATHFIGMLGYNATSIVAYAEPEALASLLIAVAGTIAAAGVAASGGAPPARRLAGGALLGLSIAGMHYLGMEGMRMPFLRLWDAATVLASLATGMGFSMLAFMLLPDIARLRTRLAMAALLTIAVGGLHFTAMSALTLLPDETMHVVPMGIAPQTLGLMVAMMALLILGAALAGGIVDHRLADQAARQARRFRLLADASFEGLLIHRDGIVLDANTALCRLLGRPAGEVIGRGLAQVIVPHALLPVLDEAGTDAAGPREIDLLLRGGRKLPVEAMARRIEHDGRPAEVVVLRDLREQRAAQDRIRHMAHHDALTGLANRTLFADRLDQAMAQAARATDGALAVLYLDLDRFKAVNDCMGHAAGDALLCQVAARLRASLRESDTVARLGGDEFAVLQAGGPQPAAAAALAQRLIDSLGLPFDHDGQELDVGVSIGIAIYPDDGADAELLLQNADTAMYRAKAQPASAACFFEPSMDLQQRERRRLERDLRLATSQERLEVHYQPLVSGDEQKVVGYEALVRWRDPERGPISPAEFIPLAEECGLIVPIGAWVLRTACMEAASWPGTLTVAVNVSPVQFRQGDLPRLVVDVLAETGLDPARLELEITEGVLLDNADLALVTLRRLKALGVRLSLDDFGTGYSSLSYLSRYPFDKVKIDQSFVRQMLNDENALAIVRAIIQLCRNLRIHVTAEGVETEAQRDALRLQQCDQMQGYLLGRPMPRDALASLRPAAPAAA